MFNTRQLIIAPLVTEKSNRLRERNQYTFKVHLSANKLQIISFLRKEFNVTPLACNVIRNKPRPRRTRLTRGTTRQWKKAIVTLKEGDTIALFEGT